MSETVQIPKGWKNIKVFDIVESRLQGLFHSGGYKTEGIPLLRITDLDNKGNIKYGNIPKIETSQKNIDRFQLKKGDIVIARTGGAGRSAIVDRENHPLLFAAYLIRFRFKQEAFPQFINYFLRSGKTQNQFFGSIHGSSNKNINAQNVLDLDILLPPIPTQKKIVQKLDDILEQLEEKKKEIFSIIVQNTQRIDFFEKNWLSYLILREIEQNPKRKEWQNVHTLDVVEDPKRSVRIGPFGSSLKKHELTDSGIRVLFIENVVNNKFEYKTGKFITPEKYKELQNFTVKPNDILVTMMGTIGRICIVPEDIGTAIISSHLTKISLDQKKILSEYFILLLRSPIAFNQMKKEARGISMPGLNSKIIKNLEFPLPPIPIQKQIVQNIKSAEEKFQSQKVQFENIKQNYEKTINHINHIQSSILDAAFSGKLVQ